MKGFKFRFEAVEKVRLTQEEKALAELSRCQRELQAKIQAKLDLLEEKKNAYSKRNEMAQGFSSPVEYRLYENYFEGIAQRLVRADQAILRARRFVDQAMRYYQVARKQRRMMDVLREKDLHQFKVEQAKEAQKKLDDLITMRHRMIVAEGES